MKKSTIWTIAGIVGVTFLTLLFFQTKYFEEVLKMRKEQLDESVARSLYQAARQLELNEARKSLEQELLPARRQVQALPSDSQRLRPHTTPATLSKDYFINRFSSNVAGDGVERGAADSLRLKMEKQLDLLEEVAYSMLYHSSEYPLAERIDFRRFDSDLRFHLRANGVMLDYHFYITTSDGRVVYRCPDYTADGDEMLYRQVLFPNDSPAQMGILYIHFPGLKGYLFSSVRFMMPALFFTVFLLIVFIFTIYTIFRQKRLTEIKNDFINNMTHEFKTPISTISLAAQMLKDPSVAKSEAMFNHISGVIIDETKRLRFQVEKVLQMSMFDRKAATFKCKELDANAMIEDIANTFRLKVEASGGQLLTNLEATDPIVYVDEMHFTNVIFNLLDNAVKYASPDRSLLIRVTTRNEGHKLVVAIEDNGIGIRREDLKKIFEKFFRVPHGNRHDVKGFGLGLAYVHNVVRALKGQIHAESDFGKGTRFLIHLPLMSSN